MSLWASWSVPFLQWRERLLANPDFQRRAFQWPIARWIARRRVRSLFDVCSGFVYSQVLLACTRLDLFRILAQSPRSAEELARLFDLPQASVERLLEAAAALQLVETRDSPRFGLGSLGAALLGNPAVAMMIEHHGAFYSDMEDPISLLKGDRDSTNLSRFWGYSRNSTPKALGPEETTAYSELMAQSQSLIAEQVLSAYPVYRHHRLLDVGGGTGAFAKAALEACSPLEACVFDLPSVAERAREHFSRWGVGERGSVSAGDFLDDPLPGGFDLITLVRILHDHDDEAALELLRAVRHAIDPGGVLLIAEPMRGTAGAKAIGAAYFGFYLLAMGQGKPRTRTEISSLLKRAGFKRPREHRTAVPLLVRVLVAKPE